MCECAHHKQICVYLPCIGQKGRADVHCLTLDRAELCINAPSLQIAAEGMPRMRCRKLLVVNYRYGEHLTRPDEKRQGIVHRASRRACCVPRHDNPVVYGCGGVRWHENNWPATRKQGGLDELLAGWLEWSAHIDNQD